MAVKTPRERGYTKGLNTTRNRIKDNRLTIEDVQEAFLVLTNTPVPSGGGEYVIGVHEGTWDALKEILDADAGE
jgi:hypothetical protein